MQLKLKWGLMLALLPMTSVASEIALEYSGFYDRLKKVNKGEFPRTELTFSVPLTDGCIIQKGEIVTADNQRFPLSYSQEQRLYIPFDEHLKLNRGLVMLTTDGDATACGLKLQVRERVTGSRYTGDELRSLKTEMDELQAQLQGFPMKYFAKPADGLRFEFSSNENSLLIDGKSQTVGKELILTVEALEKIESLALTQAVSLVSPWFDKAQ